MGLSGLEREGCSRVLMLLNSEDLFSLAGTVTKHTMSVCTRAEAINVILQNSQSATELLNRRKVYRDTIFQYLSSEGVFLQAKSTKTDVMLKAIAHWKEKHHASYTVPSLQSTVCPPRGISGDESSTHGARKKENPSGQIPKPSSTSKMAEEMKPSILPLDCKMFEKDFCKLFDPILTSQNPSLRQEKGNWGPQHFSGNAFLHPQHRPTEPKKEYHCAQSASSRLPTPTQNERLSFHPNNDKVKSVNSPKGFVEVGPGQTCGAD
ncbi:uncharacterized protein C3orf38 homolog [Pseudophryne corroboree]|uniref:uncharacterized protein C3orf38 homolog n=1 Tax=Pseudophryne corroboree TaxID=495146 RepID=UPI003081F0A4